MGFNILDIPVVTVVHFTGKAGIQGEIDELQGKSGHHSGGDSSPVTVPDRPLVGPGHRGPHTLPYA